MPRMERRDPEPATGEPDHVVPAAPPPGEDALVGPEPKASGAAAENPARGDLQHTDQPCPECFPDGWPDQVFSLGCDHGTWLRETKH